MKGYWENLRPFEKRVVAAAGVLLFIVLNFVFVFPHFSDLSSMQFRMAEAQRKLGQFQSEIAQTNTYNTGLRQLEGEGLDVPAEEQLFQFQNTVNAQAGKSGVRFLQNGKVNTETNQFFLTRSQSISVQGGEPQLVDFLYNLGSANSMIRVRDLTLRPDPPRQQIVANVKLVASYQKKSTARPAAAPTSKSVASNPAKP
jgi:Tfp pilus assembly protein PilO